jgi:hypothetical protein
MHSRAISGLLAVALALSAPFVVWAREKALPAAAINVTRTADGVRLVAVVYGPHAGGKYKLTVNKSGGSGMSAVSQSGTFPEELDADPPQRLATSSIGVADGGYIEAFLKVELSSGRTLEDRLQYDMNSIEDDAND